MHGMLQYQNYSLGRCPHRPIRVSFRLVRTPARELECRKAPCTKRTFGTHRSINMFYPQNVPAEQEELREQRSITYNHKKSLLIRVIRVLLTPKPQQIIITALIRVPSAPQARNQTQNNTSFLRRQESGDGIAARFISSAICIFIFPLFRIQIPACAGMTARA